MSTRTLAGEASDRKAPRELWRIVDDLDTCVSILRGFLACCDARECELERLVEKAAGRPYQALLREAFIRQGFERLPEAFLDQGVTLKEMESHVIERFEKLSAELQAIVEATDAGAPSADSRRVQRPKAGARNQA